MLITPVEFYKLPDNILIDYLNDHEEYEAAVLAEMSPTYAFTCIFGSEKQIYKNIGAYILYKGLNPKELRLYMTRLRNLHLHNYIYVKRIGTYAYFLEPLNDH